MVLCSPLCILQKFFHIITLGNEFKVAFKGVNQVSLSPSLNLKYVLFILICLLNLVSLNQLTWSLNCYLTFDVGLFYYIAMWYGRLIEVRYESKGLLYRNKSFCVLCCNSISKAFSWSLVSLKLSELKKMVLGLNRLQMLNCELC